MSVLGTTFRTDVRIIHTYLERVLQMAPAHVRAQIAQPGEVLADGTSGPIEFSFGGRRFRIHAVLSRWCEAGGWWNRISDGNFHPDDQARAVWKVEAAPIGTLQTFELERDDLTGAWIIKVI